MESVAKPEREGNLLWAGLFAGVVMGLFFFGVPVAEAVFGDQGTNKPAYALTVLALVLAPFALVWLVGELHLELSPRDRVARGIVGWLLALATLALLVVAAPLAFYILIVSLDGLF
ncbi:hypothetical protein [Knoellia subterranea]|uniref:Uncharacterized protein n=1 Tax=Knoellia subterranea KCTC 19937 TaxID=1385521 RepID=A0A0A0JJU1_9MICO|nr:hypothetical protein [Knoellia subterranea]KGN37675.1 hypothetical protein N803_11500 [Knoellia subterranea KCTC 19937]